MLSREHIRSARSLFVIASLILALVLFHLAPLPPTIWQALPGRDLIVAIDEAAGLSGVWRPLTMDPTMTRNALWSLAAPLAGLVLAAQLTFEQHKSILLCILGIGSLSALLGLVQIVEGGGARFIFMM